MVGMADGYAQAQRPADARQPAHRARASATRWARSSTRRPTSRRCWSPPASRCARMITMQANLTNRDATRMPHPLVKWSYEPPRAAGRPARARARDPPRVAAAARARRSSRSRWTTGTPRSTTRDASSAIERRVTGRAGADPAVVAALAARLDGAANPVLVAGPDIDASGAWDAAVALAERQRLPVWATPAPGGGRLGFPEGHPHFHGILPPAIGPRRPRRSRATTWCWSSARRCSPTTRTSRARCCPRAPRWSRSRATPTRRRARRWATRSSPTSGSTLEALLADGRASPTATAGRAAGRRRTGARGVRPDQRRRRSTTRSPRRFPDDGIVVLESPSSTLALRNQLRLSRPGQLLLRRRRRPRLRARRGGRRAARPARPAGRLRDRRGLGAVRDHGASGRAAAYEVPVTFLVLRNERVRDPQVVRRDRGGRAARRGSTCRRSTRRRSRPATASSAARGRRPRRAARGARDGDRRRARPSWSRSASRPGMCAVLEAAGSGSRAQRRAGAPAPSPLPTASPDWARRRARPSRCARELDRAARRRPRARAGPRDLVRYASDASPYRLIPQAVVMAHDAADVAKVLALRAPRPASR